MKIYWYRNSKNLIGHRLHDLRISQHLTQRQLAARMQLAGMEMNEVTILRIEKGVRFVPDYEVAELAKALGDEETYRTFNDRGYWWRNVISDEGYCHMRDSKGQWLENFDPFRSGANQHYVEGNAWQLTFFVPQDVPALVEKIGKQRFTDRLLWGFNQDEAWRYNAPNDQYWDHPVVQGNQQSMHFAFLFNYADTPWNTQRWSRSILDRYYGYGIANAYLGDEDQGQMSAWAIMTSIGLFQTDGGCRVDPV